MKFSTLIVSHSENTQKAFRFFFSILLVSIISISIGFSQCNSDNDCGNGFACIPPNGDCNFETTGDGVCVDTNEVWGCNMMWDPVCGCDGATYGNDCQANYGGYTGVDYFGECNEPPPPDCCDAVELATDNCGGLGCYIPQCTENCEWLPMQCWPSIGDCWCVDEEGNEIDGYPDCEDEIGDEEIGDECILENGEIGFYDCELCCWDEWTFKNWLGDDWCDYLGGCGFEGPLFNCSELGYDCGACNIDWDGSDPLGFCEELCTEGDLTEDGAINVSDVVFIVHNIILQPPSEDDPWDFWLCAGDFNGDGAINVIDIISLVNLILNPPISEDCLIIPEIGPCDGICPTYYYNQNTNQCEEFITGCCGIEAFDTQQSCAETCE